jgi:hypothetical protein
MVKSVARQTVSKALGVTFDQKDLAWVALDGAVLRAIQTVGRILPLPILGGLHHQYVRI